MRSTEFNALRPRPLKVKSQDIFDAWVSKLRHHRLYRQNEIVRSPREATMRTFPPPAAIESPQPASSVAREAKVRPPNPLMALHITIIKLNTRVVYKIYENSQSVYASASC